MTFIVFAAETIRMIVYLVTAIGLIVITYYGVKALKVEKELKALEKEKREEIKRFRNIIDYMEKFFGEKNS